MNVNLFKRILKSALAYIYKGKNDESYKNGKTSTFPPTKHDACKLGYKFKASEVMNIQCIKYVFEKKVSQPKMRK